MRALLLYNPNATTTDPALIAGITKRLSNQLKLDVEATKRRDHAGFLAAAAADSGYEVVIALGGDGTVNEVVQGLAETDAVLAVIPGGSTNVFARALGLPNDAEHATEIVLEKLARRESRRITLGSANDRLFTFNVGFGFDAEVVKRVERRAVLKQTVRQASFVYAGADAMLRGYPRGETPISVRADGRDLTGGVASVVACNTRPFTFLGRYAIDLCPGGSFDRGLAVTTLDRVSLPMIARLVYSTVRSHDVRGVKGVDVMEDLDEVVLTSAVELPLQVDGDHLGDMTKVVLCTVRDAVTVAA